MPRPRRFTPAEERHIGRVCIRARRRGVPWKRLMRRYGLGRTKLHELAGVAEKDVREHIGAGQLRLVPGYAAAGGP